MISASIPTSPLLPRTTPAPVAKTGSPPPHRARILKSKIGVIYRFYIPQTIVNFVISAIQVLTVFSRRFHAENINFYTLECDHCARPRSPSLRRILPG